MSTSNIPLVDLKLQLAPIRQEVDQKIREVLDNTSFILGGEVSAFEQAFANYCGAKYSVGVASGLDALHLGCRALGIGPGDEVIIPAHTFIATALGVSQAGATPVFVDVDPNTFCLDASLIEKKLTAKTKAILPVHLYGRCMDLSAIEDLCKRKGLLLIEDAAQSHGAGFGGKRAGARGALGCFSFYPGKNLGCAGDGGAITTNDPAIRDRLLALRNYGSVVKYDHPIAGYNSRLDTLQAAILNVKLKHLDSYNKARNHWASAYNNLLEGAGDLVLPQVPSASEHVFHLYVIRTQRRDALLKFLNERGIGAGIHYPTPMHLHGAYKHLNYKAGDFPQSERICKEIVSLPLFPELTEAQVQRVAQEVRAFFNVRPA